MAPLALANWRQAAPFFKLALERHPGSILRQLHLRSMLFSFRLRRLGPPGPPLIVVGWALLLFCGFGVMSGLNLTSVVAVALGAFAVATAIFLILELNRPFSGLLHVPTMSIETTLKALETPLPKG